MRAIDIPAVRLCLPECVFIGEVNYIDYDKESFEQYQMLNFIMHKRLSFAHERELRAIFWEMDGSPEAQPYKDKIGPSGLTIEVQLSSLIENVYVSPTAAAPWFAKLVEDLTAKCGFAFPICHSALATAPFTRPNSFSGVTHPRFKAHSGKSTSWAGTEKCISRISRQAWLPVFLPPALLTLSPIKSDTHFRSDMKD
ncbi:hypothetical protein [Bradyrhizobium neotropicale]|uniref:Uncharacterized protein n=1 Tax=Bradyrhizobium neotropicale TaxID=1497615 RepID=A0A176YPJ4_9BRAD|nr:hypothetical protein [Bradyrhizobium neotropicale]OAF09230.1 hypothetical protein AXW67_26910 [Bradyrhizobium neotropicale]